MGGQGPHLRSIENFSRSSEAIDCKKKKKCEGPTDRRSDRSTDGQSGTRLKMVRSFIKINMGKLEYKGTVNQRFRRRANQLSHYHSLPTHKALISAEKKGKKMGKRLNPGENP